MLATIPCFCFVSRLTFLVMLHSKTLKEKTPKLVKVPPAWPQDLQSEAELYQSQWMPGFLEDASL